MDSYDLNSHTITDIPHRQGSTFVLSYFLRCAHAQHNLGLRINCALIYYKGAHCDGTPRFFNWRCIHSL
jgi:hypothetical protein